MASRTNDILASVKQMIAERRYQDAVRTCRRELLSKPRSEDVRVLLGHALLAIGRFGDVRTEMQTLLRITPESAAAHRVLGEALLRLGQRDKAREALEQALAFDAQDQAARELLLELDAPSRRMDGDRRFADETTTAEASPMASSLPSMTPPVFDDPTQTSTNLAGYSASVELDSDFAQDLEELEGESTVMTSPVLFADAMRQGEELPGDPTIPLGQEKTTAGLPPKGFVFLGEKTSTGTRALPPEPTTPIGMQKTATGPAPSGGTKQEQTEAVPSTDGEPPADALPPAPTTPMGAARGRRTKKRTMMGMGPVATRSGARQQEKLAAQEEPGEGRGRLPNVPTARLRTSPPSGAFDDATSSSKAAVSLADANLVSAELSASDLLPGSMDASLDELDVDPLDDIATRSRGKKPPVEPFEDEATRAKGRRPGLPTAVPSVPVAALPPAPAYAPPKAAPPAGRVPPRAAPPVPRPGRPAAPGRVPPAPAPVPSAPTPIPSGQGLPPLEEEATRARPADPAHPFGDIAVSATPMPIPGATPIPTPALTPGMVPDAVSDAPPPPTGPPKGIAHAGEGTGKGAGAALQRFRSLWRSHAPSWTQVSDRWPPAVLAALSGIPVLLIAMSVFAYRSCAASSAEEQVALAARRATNAGTLPQLQEALRLDAEAGSEEPNAIARRALLYAMASLEHGAEEETRVEGLLAGVDASLPLAILSKAYLQLENGRVDLAQGTLEALPDMDGGGEAAYARALAAFRAGDTQSAVAFARSAQSHQPSATRYSAFLVRALLTAGQIEDAAGLAEGLEGDTSAVVALAEARVRQAQGNGDATRRFAEQVIDAAGSSGRQKEWARLLAAEGALLQGDQAQAAIFGREAIPEGEGPIGDESFVLSAADVLRRAGAAVDGARVLGRLPETPSNAPYRATIRAEVYLAAGQIAEAEAAVGDAPDSARTAMLRGRVAEAKGDTDAARRAYEAAASDATEGFGARLRLAAIDFDAGDEAEAVRGLEGIRAGHEGHPELVSLLVRALLAEGEKERAAEVVRAGRRENPDDLRIQSAEADVYIARGLYEEALTALGRLVEAQPNDASLQVSLGRAALKAEELDRADGAFARALELEAGIRGALLGKVELAALRGNTDAMESALSAADQGGVPAAQLRRWRAELALLRGQGREAVALFEPLAGRRRTRDPVLITRLGQAQVQAEQCNDALATFRRIRRRPNVDSLVGSAYCETRRARFGPARRAIDRAAQLARSDRERARVSVARGFFALENGNVGDARSAAESALEQDASSSEAHFLMGMVTDAQGSDEAVNHFRRAVESRMPSPEAMGQLILHMRGRRTERCQLIERYQRADPRGIDARDIERVAERCR